MSGYDETGIPGQKDLLFLPLGGTGEIGMNLNLYGHDGQWLMVDCGVTFGDHRTPGIEIIMPDISFVEENKEKLAGLVLTHAHEDHLGAVHHLWDRFRCPVYATPFTASILKRKLAENGLEQEVDITIIPLSGRFAVGVFDIELITLTHSIPEPNALVIRTKAGNVMHTGDWKFDPDPMLGPSSDEQALMRVGEEGILAMVCDSTNALSPGRSGSEGEVRKALSETVAGLEGRVAIACFASNVARLESAALAGMENGRSVALVGRSLWRMQEAARENGYLSNLPPFLNDEDASYLPKDKVLYICTGSQGEHRAALARIARGDHQNVSFGEGDHVIFSSREIPGNELAIAAVQNDLIDAGVNLITARENREIHTSGHPNRDELAEMYQFIKPRVAVPVHGERRHLIAHADLAQKCQVPHGIIGHNGAVMRLTEEGATIIDEVFAGKVAIDGNQMVDIEASGLRDRRKMSWHGMAVVSLAVDEEGELVDDPMVSIMGLNDPEGNYWDSMIDHVIDVVDHAGRSTKRDEKRLAEYVRVQVRKRIFNMTGKKPQVNIHLLAV